MKTVATQITQFLSRALAPYSDTLEILGIISLLTFALSLCAIPIIARALPTDYFIRQPRLFIDHTFFRMLFVLFKNILGIALLILGIILLFLPGQGLVTLLIGYALSDLPGKHHFQLYCFRQSHVRHSINWLRRKVGRPPFLLPDTDQSQK